METLTAREKLKEEGQIRVSLRLGVARIGRVEGREFRLTEKMRSPIMAKWPGQLEDSVHRHQKGRPGGRGQG